MRSSILKFLRKIFPRNIGRKPISRRRGEALLIVGTKWRSRSERGNPFCDTYKRVLAVDNGWVQSITIYSWGPGSVSTALPIERFLEWNYQIA